MRGLALLAAALAVHHCPHEVPGRSLVLLSAQTGRVVRSFPAAHRAGAVLADGRGGWFASVGVGCADRQALWHLRADGAPDPRWQPAIVGAPGARWRGLLYVHARRSLVALDATSGALRWVVHVNGAQGIMPNGVAAASGIVYLGGDFSVVGGERRDDLAALDARTGRVLPWHGPPLPSWVEAVAVARGRVYIGGNSLQPQVQALDKRTGRRTPWTPATAHGYAPGAGVGDVENIVVAHGDVLTAGHDGWGVTDARTGAIVPWMYGTVAYTFTEVGPFVYLAGNCRNSLTAAGGAPRNNLAAIDLRTNRFTSWAPNLATYSCVASIAGSAQRVLVSGFFGDSLG